MEAHDFDLKKEIKTAYTIFGQLLADEPLGLSISKSKRLETMWLVLRVGIVATIEHFTGGVGQSTLDNSKKWEILTLMLK